MGFIYKNSHVEIGAHYHPEICSVDNAGSIVNQAPSAAICVVFPNPTGWFEHSGWGAMTMPSSVIWVILKMKVTSQGANHQQLRSSESLQL